MGKRRRGGERTGRRAEMSRAKREGIGRGGGRQERTGDKQDRPDQTDGQDLFVEAGPGGTVK